MENVNKLRIQIRAHFLEICEEVDHSLSHEQDIGAIYLLQELEDVSSRLFRMDENAENLLFSTNADEEAFAAEYKEVRRYRRDFIKYKAKCETTMKNDKSLQDQASTVSEKMKRKFKLLKLEQKKFDGNVINWLGFWGQFKKIHDDDEIDADDKFQYLLQSMEVGSPARELVESFPPSGKNYEHAVNQLKTRFARDEFLIEVYVRELLKLVLTQATRNDTGMSLRTLYDKLETQLRSLETLGVTKEKYAAMLFPLVESSIPAELLKVWQRHYLSRNQSLSANVSQNPHPIETDTLSLLLDFLKNEVESEERINLAQSSFNLKEKSAKAGTSREMKHSNQTRGENSDRFQQQKDSELYTAAALHITPSKEGLKSGKHVPICTFCGNLHSSQDCLKAHKLSLDERKTCIINKKGCFVCLKANHTSRNCRAFIKCIICTKRHYPIMCPNLPQANKSPTTPKDNQTNDSQNILTNNYSSQVLLQTVVIRIKSGHVEKRIRALLDSGSQRSYILSKCASDLSAVVKGTENVVQGVFGGLSIPTMHKIYEITLKDLNDTFQCNATVLSQSKICGSLPRLNDLSVLNELKRKNIDFADISMEPYDEIQLLIGADLFSKIITGRTEILDNGLLAVETHLGWTLMGECKNNSSNFHIFSGLLTELSISDLWKLDTLGIRDNAEAKADDVLVEKTIEFFNKTIKVNEENRYEICLPWIEGHPTLMNNLQLATARLKSSTKKLFNIGKFDDYENVLVEWENLGIIEEIHEKENQILGTHYLSHHAVLKETSNTTKIRPVFDASAKDSLGCSLNDCLEKGPNLIELIPNLLLKFRLGSIGVTADIEKAFLQISVSPKDRDFLRFLWWKDYQRGELKMYRHCRVVFGVKSSPFLLSATIAYHINRVPDHLKLTAEKLKNSFYVDNCISSVNSMIEVEKFVDESKQIMSSAYFNLREWIFNGMKENSENVRSDNLVKNYISVLGTSWNFIEDNLFVESRQINVDNVQYTKRGLLSIAHKLFDPIGIITPVTLIPKLLLHETWQMKLNWDDNLPSEIKKKFEIWLREIHLLILCRIPRTLIDFSEHKSLADVTIHVFCDACKSSFATCIFLRSKRNGTTCIRLLQAKSRLAPKNVTIPRLELLATLIGIRLCQTVKKVSEFEHLKCFYWTDSMVTLTWIKTKGNWNTFVGNRVKEIRQFSEIHDWHHVPGNLNPADLLSRGCNSKTLLQSKWWEGPLWLKNDSEEWPNDEILCPNHDEVNREAKKNVCSILLSSSNRSTQDFNYFSNYPKTLRMVAWILRFYNNLKKAEHIHKGELIPDEIELAEIYLIRTIQSECSEELSKLTLEIFKDEQDILRIKTRLVFSSELESFKYPILLPYKHKIVAKLIEEQHKINLHAGVSTLVTMLRERFWIVKCRKMTKEIVSKCIRCKRFKAKFVNTPFSPLPKERINCTAAFEVTGIDLAGPLYLKGGSKVWISVFTCAIYRAVHLELVGSLSSDSFLLALRRFISRRGRISCIYSDNGTNFVGLNNIFKHIDWDKNLEFSSAKKIKWNFNPPSAAWWGGWWERIIRIVKELLRRNLGKACVTNEELSTLLCECESIINSRPLTYIYEDSNDLSPLCPSMFISDISNSETPDLDQIDANHLVRRFRYLQNLRDNLRTRFRKEYLAELVNCVNKRECGHLSVGDIVYVGSDNKKRLDWPLGKILEIHEGRDKKPRVARVKVAQGEILRPFQRLYPLEVRQEEDSQQFRDLKADGQSSNPERRNQCPIAEKVEESRKEEKSMEKKEDSNTSRTTRYGRIVKAPQRYGMQ